MALALEGAAGRLVHRRVDQWVARQPSAVAVSAGGERLTYGELGAAADRLAAGLVGSGLHAEDSVLVALPRSADFVVAALATLKAGGKYVPIDPAYPRQRQELIAADSGARFGITSSELADTVRALGIKPILIDGPAHGPAAPQAVETSAGDAAYVIYTSGSTGVPKGVTVTHANVLSLIDDEDRLGIAPGDIVGQLAPTAFDASVFEIWCTLARGGQVAVIGRNGVSVESLAAELRTVRPDWLFITSGLFHVLVDNDPDCLSAVGTLITGGDVLSPRHIRTAAVAVRSRLYAAYGPTEATVFTTLHHVPADFAEPSVPLGTALAGRRVYVLGDRLDELPVGSVGDLYIGGEALARGYHERARITADRFVPDHLSTVAGSRLYRTGDLASRRPDGAVDFHGRVDRQLKVRGFRVELGEIEVALAECPDVASCVVTAADADDGKRLVANVVPVEGSGLVTGDLRAWLAETLPDYLRPSYYVLLEALPLDPNGKVDRAALPRPWKNRDELLDTAFTAPSGELERLVATVLAESLGLDRVGVDDDFFALGGDSLRSVSVLEQLRGHGVRLTARQFFGNPTVAGISGLAGDRPAPRVPVAVG